MRRYILVIAILLLLQLHTIHADNKFSLVLLIREKYPYKEDLVSLYKDYITNTDFTVIFPGVESITYASNLNGSNVATYFSITDIKNNIQILKDKVQYIAYNIEHNLSPDNEVNDVITSIRMASEIAHTNGFKMMLSPSGRLTEVYAREFAPYADIYILQYQALQSNPEEYARYVRDIVREIREVDSDVKLIAQVSTLRGDVNSMIDSINRVKDVVDGVTIFYGLEKSEIEKLRVFLDYIKQYRDGKAPLNNITLTGITNNNEELDFTIVNNVDTKLEFVYIVKIKSGEEVIDIKIYDYSLEAYESKQLSISYNKNYSLEIFVWSNMEHPIPLASKYVFDKV
ncbi:MAG: hypothetical protein QW416_04080 [Candidatus Nitrosocaldaceae archaeon]